MAEIVILFLLLLEFLLIINFLSQNRLKLTGDLIKQTKKNINGKLDCLF